MSRRQKMRAYWRRVREGYIDPPARPVRQHQPWTPDLDDPQFEYATIALLRGHSMADAARVSGLSYKRVCKLRDWLRDRGKLP